MPRRGRVRIGTSGYAYAHWRGPFYPEDLPAKRWFAHYADRLGTVEINNTFYRMPTGKAVAGWRDQAPDGFLYAFEASRYVTHVKRLLPGGTHGAPVENLLDRLAPLGDKLGPILFQLPPSTKKDAQRLRAFLQRIPHRESVPCALEFRHATWYDDEVLDLLGEHGIALCTHDWVHAPYQDHYGARRLAPWVKRIQAWRRRGNDVYVYFNNDERAYAARDATRPPPARPPLKRALGQNSFRGADSPVGVVARERSARALRRERLYGPPLEGEGMDLPACAAWPEDARVRVGTSGWAYRHWLGRLYPRRLPPARALAHYACRFPAVEVNSTYYRLPEARSFDAWRDATPPGFRFAVKAPGSVTHDKRLVGVEAETAEFVERCRRLGDRLGVVLVQLPPGFRADLRLLARFLDLVPGGVRVAVELRHASWFERDVRDLLASRGAAFVVHDYGRRGSPLWVTSGVAYLRLHGPSGRYRGAYDAEALLAWAEQVKAWVAGGVEAYVFFNNDERGKSVRDALALRALLGDAGPSSPAAPASEHRRGLA